MSDLHVTGLVPEIRTVRRSLSRNERERIALIAAQPQGFFSYLKRWFLQIGKDIKDRVGDTLIAMFSILIILAIQFRQGWISKDQRWQSVIVNVGPSLLVFGAYLIYHMIHATYALDSARATDIAGLLGELTETEKDLELEQAKPKLEGRIHQVYLDLARMERDSWDDGVDIDVTVQLSLGNVRRTPTSIHEFRIQITTEIATYEGRELPLEGYIYVERGQFVRTECPLGPWTVPKNPLPGGYTQGYIEADKWLRFDVSGLPVTDVDATVTEVTILATDIFEITHRITGSAPWNNRGEITRGA